MEIAVGCSTPSKLIISLRLFHAHTMQLMRPRSPSSALLTLLLSLPMPLEYENHVDHGSSVYEEVLVPVTCLSVRETHSFT